MIAKKPNRMPASMNSASDTAAHDASARTPVDPQEAVSGVQIGVVLIGISITLPLMYSAGELALGIGFSDAVLATLIGALILSLMSIPAAIVGARTRLSSYMIIEHTFGYAGAKLINFAFGVFLLGWYAVTAELFGRTLFLGFNDLAGATVPEWVYTVASSAVITVTTIYGFKAIDRLALVAVPFLLLALLGVVVLSLREMALADLLTIEGSGDLNLPTAISAVIGAAIVGVVLTPDLTRYARTIKDCISASFIGQGGGMTIAYVVGMIPVLVWNELEPMTYMVLMGFGGIALAVLIFATWTTNVINLYSTALASRASVALGDYRSVVVVMGVVGTGAALIGISDNLIEFLVVMGLLVPPVAGVYLADFFIFKRHDYSAAASGGSAGCAVERGAGCPGNRTVVHRDVLSGRFHHLARCAGLSVFVAAVLHGAGEADAEETGLRIGIDVGGTHTDAVLIDGHDVLASTKSLTSANVRDGVLEALDRVLNQSAVAHSAIEAVMIGTTQFTNAVIERRELAPTAIIRAGLPSGAMIPPMLDWPDDIADAVGRHIYMVHGGRTYDGFPIAPLDMAEVDAAINDIAAKEIRLIAISSVFSPSDPSQELQIAERILKRLPDVRITASHRIGGMGLLERENAAILNTSLLPLAASVITAFADALSSRGIAAPFYVSQNDGTLMSAEFAAEFPALTFASGPTNSLRGASLLTRLNDAVVVDIGGTTSDIGVLQGGFPRQSNVAIDVGGVRTNFRMPDIQAIGLGGGSLVAEDGERIGPQSVGYRLVQEGLVFGGSTLTTTDITVASGAAEIGEVSEVGDLDPHLVERAVQTIHRMIDQGIDQMKSSRDPVPVILVGGGAVLVSRDLSTASVLHRPEHSAVANAIGAANAQIGAETERIVSYRQTPRDEVLKSLQTELTAELVSAGAAPASVRLADVEETAISYMADESTRLRVKLVGDLDFTQRSATDTAE